MTRSSVPPSRLSRARAANAKLPSDAERFARQVRTERAQAPSEKKDWALPSFLTSKWAIFFLIIAGAIVVGEMQVGFFHYRQASKDAGLHAQCHVIRSQPNADAESRNPRQSAYFRNPPVHRDTAVRDLGQCTPDHCAPDVQERYGSTLSHYLGIRLSMTERGYREFGEAGVAHVQELHRTNDDFNIVHGARDRIKSGHLDLASLTPEKASFLQLLMAHGNNDIPVCYRPAKQR